jgi:Fe-Mn family superoxide dismutase
MERLCVHKGGKLDVCGTPNQDNPLMPGVGCGELNFREWFWEHAYYLNYQNEIAVILRLSLT